MWFQVAPVLVPSVVESRAAPPYAGAGRFSVAGTLVFCLLKRQNMLSCVPRFASMRVSHFVQSSFCGDRKMKLAPVPVFCGAGYRFTSVSATGSSLLVGITLFGN